MRRQNKHEPNAAGARRTRRVLRNRLMATVSLCACAAIGNAPKRRPNRQKGSSGKLFTLKPETVFRHTEREQCDVDVILMSE